MKQSKTDPFRQGVTLPLGRTESSIHPIIIILPFLAVRGNQPRPLLILKDGRMLTRQLFRTSLDNILDKLNLMQPYQFDIHSFHIEVATSAKEAGIYDLCKMLDHWCSDTYHQYIRTPSKKLAQLSKTLTRSYLAV